MAVVPRTFDDTVTRCFFLVMLAMACLMPIQNDTWWHLRAGQEMWTRRFVMLADEFSFTVAGAAFPNHEWLTEIVFYGIYRLAGLPGLTLFAAICVTSALALSWRLMAGAPVQRLLFTGLAMTSIVPVWTVRPHIFTLVFLMVVVHLVVRDRYWPIPILFLVWANLHGGVALGLVALGAAFAGRLYVTGLPQLSKSFLVVAASFAATCITPLGASLWWTIPESINRSSVNRIVEWRAASLADPTYLAFWVVAALFVVTTWLHRRRIQGKEHAVLVAVALALIPLALRSRRNIPPFMLVAIPALTCNLAGWLARASAQRTRENPTLNASVFVACALVCVTIVAVAWSGPAPRLKWRPLPEAVAAEVQACGDRVYNTYPDGGPLIWFAPRTRVFIDSRQDPYPVPFVQEYIELERTGDYQRVFERYGIRCAMLPDSSATAKRLQADGWRTRVKLQGWVVLEEAGA